MHLLAGNFTFYHDNGTFLCFFTKAPEHWIELEFDWSYLFSIDLIFYCPNKKYKGLQIKKIQLKLSLFSSQYNVLLSFWLLYNMGSKKSFHLLSLERNTLLPYWVKQKINIVLT